MDVGRARTQLKTSIRDIRFVYVRAVGGEGNVSLFRNLSPDAITFSGCFLLFDVEGLHSLSFSADNDMQLYVYIAGE